MGEKQQHGRKCHCRLCRNRNTNKRWNAFLRKRHGKPVKRQGKGA